METRPGIKTTEFWVTVLTALGTLVVAAGFDLDVAEMAAILAPPIAYIFSRGWAKSGVPAK